MNEYFKESVRFTRSERRGMIGLVFLSVLMLALPRIIYVCSPKSSPDYELFQSEINLWELGRKEKVEYEKNPKSKGYVSNRSRRKQPRKEVVIKGAKFNPNTVSKEELLEMGLPDYVIKTMMNFRNKGGKFYQKEDLLKVYGMKTEWYDELESFIHIPHVRKDYSKQKKEPKEQRVYSKTKDETKEKYSKASSVRMPMRKPRKTEWKYPVVEVDVNTSDAAGFERIYGIGPTYAKRIIKYRESLGGFTGVHQIAEVYGLPDSTFQKIRKHLLLESGEVSRININSATTDELKSHPYIRWKVANAIVKYRETHGIYPSVEALQDNYAISDSLYLKLAPYLTVE